MIPSISYFVLEVSDHGSSATRKSTTERHRTRQTVNKKVMIDVGNSFLFDHSDHKFSHCTSKIGFDVILLRCYN